MAERGWARAMGPRVASTPYMGRLLAGGACRCAKIVASMAMMAIRSRERLRTARVATGHEEDGTPPTGGRSAWHAQVTIAPLVRDWREERFRGQR